MLAQRRGAFLPQCFYLDPGAAKDQGQNAVLPPTLAYRHVLLWTDQH